MGITAIFRAGKDAVVRIASGAGNGAMFGIVAGLEAMTICWLVLGGYAVVAGDGLEGAATVIVLGYLVAAFFGAVLGLAGGALLAVLRRENTAPWFFPVVALGFPGYLVSVAGSASLALVGLLLAPVMFAAWRAGRRFSAVSTSR